jgi:hypothetical protein
MTSAGADVCDFAAAFSNNLQGPPSSPPSRKSKHGQNILYIFLRA